MPVKTPRKKDFLFIILQVLFCCNEFAVFFDIDVSFDCRWGEGAVEVVGVAVGRIWYLRNSVDVVNDVVEIESV